MRCDSKTYVEDKDTIKAYRERESRGQRAGFVYPAIPRGWDLFSPLLASNVLFDFFVCLFVCLSFFSCFFIRRIQMRSGTRAPLTRRHAALLAVHAGICIYAALLVNTALRKHHGQRTKRPRRLNPGAPWRVSHGIKAGLSLLQPPVPPFAESVQSREGVPHTGPHRSPRYLCEQIFLSLLSLWFQV